MHAEHFSTLFCLMLRLYSEVRDASLQLHLHQTVILVALCHVALLNAIDTPKDTPSSRNHLNHDTCELTSPQSILLGWLLLRLCFHAGWPNTCSSMPYSMPLAC